MLAVVPVGQNRRNPRQGIETDISGVGLVGVGIVRIDEIPVRGLKPALAWLYSTRGREVRIDEIPVRGLKLIWDQRGSNRILGSE